MHVWNCVNVCKNITTHIHILTNTHKHTHKHTHTGIINFQLKHKNTIGSKDICGLALELTELFPLHAKVRMCVSRCVECNAVIFV
jgi:hypothetical protein